MWVNTCIAWIECGPNSGWPACCVSWPVGVRQLQRLPTSGSRVGHASLERIQRESLRGLPGPIVRGLPYGHRPHRITLPLGLAARLDTRRGRLEMLESAVV
jgi:muramoyltetrapeptide carboxypeptidase